MRALRLVLPAVLLLAACGAQTGGVAEDEPTRESTREPSQGGGVRRTELSITLDDGSGPVTWSLTCDPPGGTHPDATSACAALEAMPDPFAPVPEGMLCTQVYGGPERAEVTGTWRGESVHATFTRTDGCEIARWAKHAAVLGVASAGPPGPAGPASSS